MRSVGNAISTRFWHVMHNLTTLLTRLVNKFTVTPALDTAAFGGIDVAYSTWAWAVAYQETTFQTKTGGGLG